MKLRIIGVSTLVLLLGLLLIGCGGSNESASRKPLPSVVERSQGETPAPQATASPSAMTAVPSPTPLPSTSAATTAPSSPGTVLYEANWSGGMDGWAGPSGWKVVSGMLVTDGTGDYNQWIRAPYQPQTADYAVEVEMQVVKLGTQGCVDPTAGIMARTDDQGGYWAGLYYPINYGNYPQGSARIAAGTITCATANNALTKQAFDAGNDWHMYRFEVKGNSLKLLIDGGSVVETTDNQFLSSGRVGLWDSGAQTNVRSFKVLAL